MLREYNSFGDLGMHFRLHGSQSLHSLQDRIDMNPNGTDHRSTELLGSSSFCPEFQSQSQAALLRQHNFKIKTYYNVASCVHCKKRIRFAMTSLRCRACPLRCHIDCCRQLRVNCIPQPAMTTKRGYLSDFAPTVAPRVPALIVHCVTEIEARGLQQEGLYRVSSTKEKCKRLRQKFLKGKATPHLGNQDLHTLCCCVKDFLRSLMSPVIPIYHRPDFVAATQLRDPLELEEQVYQAVAELQPAHRDTLAYLMLHWQRVAESPEVKMSVSNIAVIFAPTLFDDVDLDLVNVVAWQQVLRVLLLLPHSFWEQFLEVEPALALAEGDEEEYETGQGMRWRTVKTYFRSMVNLSNPS